MIYVDESWSLWRKLSSLLYDHSAEWIKWVLIYVFATYVNQSENRKINWFTASRKRVNVQKLSRVFAMCMCVTYMSCSVCAKTLLSFCVYDFFYFFISSLSACNLWLWHCLNAVHMLDYIYLNQSHCFISSHWSITSIVLQRM